MNINTQDRAKIIAKLRVLFDNHKRATSMDFEYSSDIYDFLEKEKRISLTKQEKSAIFAKAIREYTTHLNNVLNSGCSPDDYRDVLAKLQLVKTGQYSDEQMELLRKSCHRLSIIEYFDKINYLDLQ